MNEPLPVLIPRPLAYAIRTALNVSMDYDVARTEQHADHRAMQTVERYRAGLQAIPMADWAMLREEAQHLWRVLVKAKQCVATCLATPEDGPVIYTNAQAAALERQAGEEAQRAMAADKHQRAWRK